METGNVSARRSNPTSIFGFWKVRYTQALLLCLCLCSFYIIRASTSVIVIAMTHVNKNVDVQGGWKAMCTLRAIQGFCQGFIIPSIHTFLGRWAPLSERNRIGNIIYSGGNLGHIIAMLSSGYIATSKYGWPLIYYTTGALCVITGVIFMIFAADSPSSHKTISNEEKSFIINSLGQNRQRKVSNVPLRHILRSVPWYATVVAHIGAVWGYYVMMTETPSFLTNIMKLDIAQSGLMTSIPYIIGWISSITISHVADYIANNEVFKLVTVRKLANTTGTWGPAIGMIILTYIPEGYFNVAMAVIIMIVGMDAASSTGYFMNYIDLSPNFAGILVSIANCLSSGIASFAPVTAGWILKDDPSDIKKWRIIFFIAAAIYFISNTLLYSLKPINSHGMNYTKNALLLIN